jgi:hypothetical protein
MPVPATAPVFSTRARRWLARWLLVAMAFPALGPWPWLVAEAWAHAPAAHAHAAGDDDHHASDIPGTPTHPADHHCVECEVLQHLARCVPVVAPPPVVAPLAVRPLVVAPTRATLPTPVAPARLPPARAPPPALA